MKASQLFDLKGRVALVTGASSGLGIQFAKALSDNGAAVALVARRKERLVALKNEIESHGGRAIAIEADVTDHAAMARAFDEAEKAFGTVTIFVNNAGVAQKALRVNLSDLAAKGARPLGFLVSLALPADIGADWLERFAQGLRADAALYACPLFGGDTDRTRGPIMISLAMVGSVPEGTMVRRAGAKPGDLVYVSGTIGDAALGLALRKGAHWKLTSGEREHLLSR